MKKQRSFKFFIFLFLFLIGSREARFKYEEIKEEKIENENKKKIEELSEPGLYFPQIEKIRIRIFQKYEQFTSMNWTI